MKKKDIISVVNVHADDIESLKNRMDFLEHRLAELERWKKEQESICPVCGKKANHCHTVEEFQAAGVEVPPPSKSLSEKGE